MATLPLNYSRLGPYGLPLGQQFGHLGPSLEPWKYGFGPYAPKATPGIVGPLLGGGILGHGMGFGFGHYNPGMLPMQYVHSLGHHGLGHHGGIHQCHGDDGCCSPGRPCGKNEVTFIVLNHLQTM